MSRIIEKNRKWWILGAMAASISMIFIDISVLPVTLPTIQRTLGISELGLQWIVNSYILALAVLALAGGRLSDLIGHRTSFLWGLFLFAAGSALCGLSYYEWWFISSRVLQGCGAAILVPSGAAILIDAFPFYQRGKAMGIYVSIGSVFLALGPLIGGLFTQYLSWRLVFWINLPIAAIGCLLTLLSVPGEKGKAISFDFLGFLACSLGIICIVVSMMEAKRWGLLSPLTLGIMAIGVCLIALLFILDRKVEDPYINFDFFKNRLFVGTSINIFSTQFLLMAPVFWAIYFQNVLGFSPAIAGVLTLISNAPVIFAAPLGGHLLDKHGPRIPIIIGYTLLILSLFCFLQVMHSRNIYVLLASIIPFGFGIPLVLTPSYTTALSQVSSGKRGLASGTNTMIRQLGGTFGLSIMASVLLNLQHVDLLKAFSKKSATASLAPLDFEGLLSKTPEAMQAFDKLSTSTQTYVRQSVLDSFVHGFEVINLIALGAGIVGLIFTIFLITKKTAPKIDM